MSEPDYHIGNSIADIEAVMRQSTINTGDLDKDSEIRMTLRMHSNPVCMKDWNNLMRGLLMFIICGLSEPTIHFPQRARAQKVSRRNGH